MASVVSTVKDGHRHETPDGVDLALVEQPDDDQPRDDMDPDENADEDELCGEPGSKVSGDEDQRGAGRDGDEGGRRNQHNVAEAHEAWSR
jgi:hypothetical protein